MSTITKTIRIDGVLTDPTSVKLSDADEAYGVKRNDTGAAVVADGTAMTNLSTGVYSYTFTDPADDLTYTYSLEVVYSGETYWIADTFSGPTSTTEPITLTEAKNYARIDISDDDDIVTSLITAARQYCETHTNRCFVTTTRYKYYDDFPKVMYLRAPLASVTSITYYDTDGDSQTLSSTYYDVDISREPGRVVEAYGYTWPSTYDMQNAVTVTYVAGYGAASSVPDIIKTAIKMLVAHWYENREPVITGTIVQNIPLSVKSMLDSVKVYDYYDDTGRES